MSILKPNGTLPAAHVLKTFGGVKTLHLNAFVVNDDTLRALTPLSSLTSLSLGGHVWDGESDMVPSVTDEGVRALSPLTTLTHSDICGYRAVSDEGVRALPPLTALTMLRSAPPVVLPNGPRAF
jgi:hypothetical protein